MCGQIDGVLCFLTTLSLYGLVRHLLLGPAPGWYGAGWALAGLGVITKGVGFLPLLALLPFAVLERRGWPASAGRIGGLSMVGAAAFVVAIGLWFVPMMLATAAGGELLEYRHSILFQQTLTRYTKAWGNYEPSWYYVTNVLLVMWLPVIALLPWLWPRWRAALRERDTWVGVLLCWIAMVLVFFSASPGKRGVYMLPMLPAFVMVAAPWLPGLMRAGGTRRLAFGLAAALTVLMAAGALYFAVDGRTAARIVGDYGLSHVSLLSNDDQLFRQSFNSFPAKGREIIRFSRSDQVPVPDDLRIHIIGPRINQIVFDGKKPVAFFPFRIPAETSIQPAWQMAEITLFF